MSRRVCCSFALLLAFGVAGCLAKSKTVRMPDGESALRIECNYDQSNCRSKARALCHDGYNVVTQGNKSFSERRGDLITANPEDQLNAGVFKGVLYVRCR